MLGVYRRGHTTRRFSTGRAILRLEDLEARDQPSGPGEAALQTGAGQTASPTNQRPVILDFNCEEIGNGLFRITGRVLDESPGGLTVTLGGTTSAAGATTTTSADGTFSMTVQLRADGTDAGWITATTVDAQGLESDEVDQFVRPTPGSAGPA